MKNKNIVMTKEIEQKMEADPNYQPLETFEKLHNTKPSDMSRRELLATGIIPFAASIAAPSFISALAASSASAANELDCKKVAAVPLCPIINMSLAGGAPLGGEWLPRDKGLQLLPSYSLMGGGKSPSVDSEFKKDATQKQATFYAGSAFLTGVRSVASQESLLKTHFIGVPCRAGDDTAMNKQGIGGMVTAAGRTGDLMKVLGTNRSATGASNQPAMITPPAPLVVTNQNDINGALGFNGTLDSLSDAQQAKMMRTIASLASHQATNLVNQSGGEVLQKLMGCANIENADLIANQGNLDVTPLNNARMSTLYNINQNTNTGSAAFVKASVAYNVLNSKASYGSLVEGGCDGHNGTRATMDARLLQIGMEVGRLIESAVALDKKLFLYITTDGGMTGPESNDPGSAWASDRGLMGCGYIIAYDPKQESRASTTQLGYFTSGQAAAEDTVWGSDVERWAAVVFLNYLSFNNQLNLLETVIGRKFEPTQIDAVRVLFHI